MASEKITHSMDKTREQLQQELEQIKARNSELERALLQTQSSLRIIEENNEHYLELAGVILVSLDNHARITMIGGKGYEILGYEPDELIGQNWFKVCLPQDNCEELSAVFKNLMAGDIENVEYYENEIITKSGEKHYIAWHNSLLTDQAGNIIGILSSGIDLTERKLAENTLRDNEMIYNKVQEIAHIGSWDWDIPSNTLKFSPELYAIYGITPDEFDGNMATLYEKIIHPDDKEELFKAQELALKEGKPRQMEFRILRQDGSVRHVWVDATATFNDKGVMVRMIGITQDITERKNAELAYRDSESRYRMIVETAQEGIWTIDAENNTSFVNPRMAEMLGYRVDEMLGRSMFDFMDDEGRQLAFENIERRKAGIAEQHDFKFLHKNGSEIWAELMTNPLLDSDGTYIGALAMITDVTERRHSEQTLRETQKLLLRTESLAQLGSWEWDLTTNHVTWSPEMYQIYKYDSAEYPEVNFSLAMARNHPDDQKRIDDYIKTVMETGLTSPIVYRIILPDSTIRYLWTESEITKNDQGQLTHMFGSVQDITERKHTEEKLQRQKEEQQQLINNIADAVIVIDEHGTIQTFNRSAETMFGYRAKEVLGQNINLLMPTEDGKQHNIFMETFLSIHIPKIINTPREVNSIRKNGEIFPMRLSVAELPKSIEGTRRFIGACHDLTIEKQQEEQLRRSQKMDALGKLTGGIAHDYNNMLGVILGYSRLLQDALAEDPKLSKYIYEIHHASERGTKLSRKLLAFSRNIQPEAAATDINEVLSNEQDMLQKTLTPRVSLELDLIEDVWSICINSGDLEDAILNLCINGMHAIDSGGKITISTRNKHISQQDAQKLKLSSGDYVVLSISDTGCGIESNNMSLIFDPFFTTKGEGGIGLGLSMVYGFVHRSGGEITVNSIPDRGSQFTLYFPRLTESPASEVEVVAHAEENLQGNETILVVDDEPAMVDLSSEILTAKGYRVLTASNAIEALKIFNSNSIDMLLSDVIMPGMDGYQLSSEVRRVDPNIKILLVSGFTENRHLDNTDPNFKQNLLPKPFTDQQLLRHIRQILGEQTKVETTHKPTIMVMDDDENIRKLYKINLEKLGYENIDAIDGEQAISLYRQSLENNHAIDVCILDITIPGGIGGKETAEKILSMNPQANLIVSSGDSTGAIMTNYQNFGFKAVLEKTFDRQQMQQVLNQVLTPE